MPRMTMAANSGDSQRISAATYTPPQQRQQAQTGLPWLKLSLGVAAIAVAVFLWFIFTARSVQFAITPTPDRYELDGGFKFALGQTWLLREGTYQVTARKVGYQPADVAVEVGSARSQRIELALTPLPGRLSFSSTPAGASVQVDGVDLGQTPIDGALVEAGTRRVTFSHPLYLDTELELEVNGRDEAQSVSETLAPNFGTVVLDSAPQGAAIRIDGDAKPASDAVALTTPIELKLAPGEHALSLKASGHKRAFIDVDVALGERVVVPLVNLAPADGLVTVTSKPSGAGVTVGGRFLGTTPIEFELAPEQRHRLRVFKAGFAAVERSVTLSSGSEESIALGLTQLTGTLNINSQPAGAEVLVNGESKGSAPLSLTLTAEPHVVQLRLPGYAGYRKRLEPKADFTAELNVKLLTEQQARLAALKPTYATTAGQTMVLLEPSDFTMGASRREPGRRSNETLREVRMTRLFYLSEKEVTNAEFRAFAAGHDSGSFEENTLNKDDQPAVSLSWHDAAGYANWLSGQENREPYYDIEFGKVIGVNANALGYRLPTEAEWAWSARSRADGKSARFAWGPALPPPERFTNLADRSAAHVVGRIVFGYNDNHIVSAPVGSFAADGPWKSPQLYDLTGNVAEWTNDYYEIPNAETVSDPVGPSSGEYRVIRGSSWMHGTMTDVRLSFRDYGIDGREDIGFRLARWAE